MYLYTNGMLQLKANNLPALDYYAPADDSYGEEIGNMDNTRLDIRQIDIPSLPDLPDALTVQLSHIDPLAIVPDYGVGMYMKALNIIQSFFN